MVERSEVLVTADELAAELAGDHPPILLDVRWRLDHPDGWDGYIAGHIPGAAFVRLDSELSDPWQPVTAGRHPLPKLQDFESAARGWGLNDDSQVVVYDDNVGIAAARAWWLLRYAGFSQVRLLDGGLASWRASGHALETGVVIPKRGNAMLRYGALPVVDIDEAAAFPEHGTLIDARPVERFRGEVEPVDPVAGHIPGAVSFPAATGLDDQGRFLAVAELRERFAALGVAEDIAVYCGSGVSAAHAIIALTLAGHRPALFPGSWSQWSNDPDRPVAIGD